MNAKTESFVHLIVAVVIMFVVSVIAYYIGVKVLETSILNGAQNAGIKVLKAVDWARYYFYLVLYMGVAASLVLVFWSALTHWILRASDSTGIGKRWLWVTLGIIMAALCVAIPYFYAETYGNSGFVISESGLLIDSPIPFLFIACYCLVGYWGGSIFVTSAKYKYTPLFAGFFHA